MFFWKNLILFITLYYFLYMKDLHNKIIEFRKKANLTQKEVSEKLGLTHSNYVPIEKGRTKLTIDKIEKLSGIFGISVFELLGGEVVTTAVVSSNEVEKIMKENELLRKENELLNQLNKSKELNLKNYLYIMEEFCENGIFYCYENGDHGELVFFDTYFQETQHINTIEETIEILYYYNSKKHINSHFSQIINKMSLFGYENKNIFIKKIKYLFEKHFTIFISIELERFFTPDSDEYYYHHIKFYKSEIEFYKLCLQNPDKDDKSYHDKEFNKKDDFIEFYKYNIELYENRLKIAEDLSNLDYNKQIKNIIDLYALVGIFIMNLDGHDDSKNKFILLKDELKMMFFADIIIKEIENYKKKKKK